jgi:hypothetical protein
MVRHSIEAVLILDKVGIPRFFMQLNPRARGLDPVLASSFFSAIDIFSREVFQTNEPIFTVDYGARMFTVITGVKTNLIAVSLGPQPDEVPSILTSLLAEFELEWLASASKHDLDTSFVEIYLRAFGERVMEKLAFQDIPEKWIPYFLPDVDLTRIGRSKVIALIDGERSIERIKIDGHIPEKDLLLQISKLWAQRAIKFRNMLSKTDVISPRTQFTKLLHSDSEKRLAFEEQFPTMLSALPRLAALIDGRRTIGYIGQHLEGKYEEKQLFDVLDYLLDMKAIETLSPEKRRILLGKEALDTALHIAEDVYSAETVANAIDLVIEKTTSPEALGQLRFLTSGWAIDFDFRLYEGIHPNRLMVLFGDWMKIIAQFTDALDPMRLELFADSMAEALVHDVFSRYTGHDMRGFEEYAYWLELLTADSWPRARFVRTGVDLGVDKDLIQELAETIVTRGQAIYGPVRMKFMCLASGVSMGEHLSPKLLSEYSKETIELLITNYSRLGPAARLTIAVLGKQKGIPIIPEELILRLRERVVD